MFKSQAVADLAVMLSGVTSIDAAETAITRALRASGLAEASTIDDSELLRLLAALAVQGGPMEQIAVWVAVHGLEGQAPATRPAA